MKTGEHEGAADAFTLEKLRKVIGIAQEVGRFDEKTLFQGENAIVCTFLALRLFTLNLARFIGFEGRVQAALPQRVAYHGLRWM